MVISAWVRAHAITLMFSAPVVASLVFANVAENRGLGDGRTRVYAYGWPVSALQRFDHTYMGSDEVFSSAYQWRSAGIFFDGVMHWTSANPTNLATISDHYNLESGFPASQ